MNYMVSIIVPVYNMERYLRECMNSLLCQSYANIEIILVDDGSKDASSNICDEYAQSDHRVMVIHKENEGLGYARNTGIKVAKGNFITFVDPDDYVDSDMIEELMQPIIGDGADTCMGGFRRVDSRGTVVSTEMYPQQHFEGGDVYHECFIRMLGSAPSEHDAFKMSVWNVIYSLNIIRKNHLQFPSEREMISEDLVFNSEYYKYAQKVHIIKSTAYNYRITPGSLTNSYREDKIIRVCDFYEEMENRIQKEFRDSGNAIVRLQKQFFVNVRICISQEKKKVSQKDLKSMMTAVANICCHPTVRRVINSFPVKKLHLKQRIFIFFVKHKMKRILCLVSNFELI